MNAIQNPGGPLPLSVTALRHCACRGAGSRRALRRADLDAARRRWRRPGNGSQKEQLAGGDRHRRHHGVSRNVAETQGSTQTASSRLRSARRVRRGFSPPTKRRWMPSLPVEPDCTAACSQQRDTARRRYAHHQSMARSSAASACRASPRGDAAVAAGRHGSRLVKPSPSPRFSRERSPSNPDGVVFSLACRRRRARACRGGPRCRARRRLASTAA